MRYDQSFDPARDYSVGDVGFRGSNFCLNPLVWSGLVMANSGAGWFSSVDVFYLLD